MWKLVGLIVALVVTAAISGAIGALIGNRDPLYGVGRSDVR